MMLDADDYGDSDRRKDYNRDNGNRRAPAAARALHTGVTYTCGVAICTHGAN